jgi:hypothetical protein
MEGREPGEPKGWSDDNSSSTPPSSPEASDDSAAPSEPADLLH